MPDFKFTVDENGNFEYDPPGTWNYDAGETIKVESTSGPFVFRFIHVDPSDGQPITNNQASPVVDSNGNQEMTIRSESMPGGGQGFIRTTRNDPAIIAAGLARTGIPGLVAEYRYAIACLNEDQLFVDATHGGEWGC